MTTEIIETKAMRNGWETFTGRYRLILADGAQVIRFELPGRGGKVSKQAAEKIAQLWQAGKSIGEICVSVRGVSVR